jgi:hypothetical protein
MLQLESLADPRLAENDYQPLLSQATPGQPRIAANEDPLSVVEVCLGHFAGVPEYRKGAV